MSWVMKSGAPPSSSTAASSSSPRAPGSVASERSEAMRSASEVNAPRLGALEVGKAMRLSALDAAYHERRPVEGVGQLRTLFGAPFPFDLLILELVAEGRRQPVVLAAAGRARH